MYSHPQISIKYLLIIKKGDILLSQITLSYFATIGREHRFWNLTDRGAIVKVNTDEFPEWEENEYKFKIVQG